MVNTYFLAIIANCDIRLLLFQNKYRAKGIEAFKEYSVVTETPVYETAKQNAVNLSDVSDFVTGQLSLYCSPWLIIALSPLCSCTTVPTTTSTSRAQTPLPPKPLTRRGPVWLTTFKVT